MIRFYHVFKSYSGNKYSLSDLSLHIAPGEFVFLTGASGAGKTTMLKLIIREEMPTKGQILVYGRNVSSLPVAKIPKLRRSIGVVFQDFKLIKSKTVFENVTFVLKTLGFDMKKRRIKALNVLKQVGLQGKLHSYPMELSGGEQQRVAIARAIVNDPVLLLADEPTGNLDPEMSTEIMKLFAKINMRGTTVLIATHNQSLIECMRQRVLVLDAGRMAADSEDGRL
ncbi:MAG: cell division ATP-binding protein FtsE [Acidobacteria bacterium]|nr:MAG: cell division ATP-binding protein FtsE [Acidobacteriota bacterium]PIE89695.1 MAG: cell division ATP-binding protein FtsE [Acidobacteriota bacterium]